MVRDWEMRVLQRLYIDFYLNERLALTEWARQHGCVLVRLPSVRGNRQTVNLEITKAILANLRAPLDHDGKVRVDGDQDYAPCYKRSNMPLKIVRIYLVGIFTHAHGALCFCIMYVAKPHLYLSGQAQEE